MDAAEKLWWPFSDGSVTDLLDARSLHGSHVRLLGAAQPWVCFPLAV